MKELHQLLSELAPSLIIGVTIYLISLGKKVGVSDVRLDHIEEDIREIKSNKGKDNG